ncbi:hypothetical protein M404DRAFT_1007582, partial [Pisolithus tinctorius Marx 270]
MSVRFDSLLKEIFLRAPRYISSQSDEPVPKQRSTGDRAPGTTRITSLWRGGYEYRDIHEWKVAPKIEGLCHEQSLYGTADIRSWHSLIRNNPLTSDCQVIGVGWYKKRKGVEHEFLRFDISSPDNQHTCIVIAERSGGGVRSPNSDATQAADTIAQMDTAVDATASPLTPPETSALSPDVGDSTASSADESSPPLDKKMNTAQIAASLSSSSKRDAYDRVYFATRISAAGDRVEEMCDRPRLACTLSFTGAKPTANELATLLYVTSAQEPKYNLHDTQCYWFAATVFDALKTLYKGPEQDPTPNLGG